MPRRPPELYLYRTRQEPGENVDTDQRGPGRAVGLTLDLLLVFQQVHSGLQLLQDRPDVFSLFYCGKFRLFIFRHDLRHDVMKQNQQNQQKVAGHPGAVED